MRAMRFPYSAEGRADSETTLAEQIPHHPFLLLSIHFKSFFGGKLMYLNLPAWNFGLYHFHTLLDSEETSRQLICKDARGDGGCINNLHPSPSCPAYALLSLWPGGAAPSTHQALARAVG